MKSIVSMCPSIATTTTVYLLFYVIRATSLLLSSHFQHIDEEAKLIKVSQKYINVEKERLINLEKHKETLIQHSKQYKSEEELAANPLAIYKTIKHLTLDFENLKKIMVKTNYNGKPHAHYIIPVQRYFSASNDSLKFSEVITENLQQESYLALGEDHLYDELRSLVHLQREFNLTISDIIEGRLRANLTVGPTLTPVDCFHNAKISAQKNDFSTAVEWLLECKDKFNELTQMEAFEIIIRSALLFGDIALAQKITNKCVEDRTDNWRILSLLNVRLNQKHGKWRFPNEYNQWASIKACAGDYDHEMAYRNLKCRYVYSESPFLTIAPLKEEMLSLAPKVSIFREALYDSEIELLKTEAYEKLHPARLMTRKGPAVDVNYRSTMAAVLDSLESKYDNVRKRLEDMGSLSLRINEGFQVIHYAPGGFYAAHNDFLREGDKSRELRGNRMAALLLYLNDVTLGGHTVFSLLKLNIRPVKGSVLFWMNLKIDSSKEELVNHAACPVIYGEKVVCTQWFAMKCQDHWITKAEENVSSACGISKLKRNQIAYK